VDQPHGQSLVPPRTGATSIGLALVALAAGTTAFSAIVSAFAATEASQLEFVDAYVLVLPLSVLVAGISWAAFREQAHPLALAFAAVVGALGISYLAGRLGIDVATRDAMAAAIESVGSSPWVRPFGVLDAYLTYYTWVPFIGGIVAGLATGWTCFRLTGSRPE
jgi:hypothetical protein